jgi:hypothetical protein
MHVAKMILVRDSVRVREGRQVRGVSAAIGEDVADVQALEDDQHEVIEVQSRRRDSGKWEILGHRGGGDRCREARGHGEPDGQKGQDHHDP